MERRRRYGSHSHGHRVGKYWARYTRMGRDIVRFFENIFREALTATNNLNIRITNSIFSSNFTVYFDRWIDYFDGMAPALNSLSTGSLNSFVGNPPPLLTNRINEIPEVSVTSDQVTSRLQCFVCFEDYEVGEIVRSLRCQHLYHDVCIRPWLELHAICPVCRTNLFEGTTDTDDTSATL